MDLRSGDQAGEQVPVRLEPPADPVVRGARSEDDRGEAEGGDRRRDRDGRRGGPAPEAYLGKARLERSPEEPADPGADRRVRAVPAERVAEGQPGRLHGER